MKPVVTILKLSYIKSRIIKIWTSSINYLTFPNPKTLTIQSPSSNVNSIEEKLHANHVVIWRIVISHNTTRLIRIQSTPRIMHIASGLSANYKSRGRRTWIRKRERGREWEVARIFGKAPSSWLHSSFRLYIFFFFFSRIARSPLCAALLQKSALLVFNNALFIGGLRNFFYVLMNVTSSRSHWSHIRRKVVQKVQDYHQKKIST